MRRRATPPDGRSPDSGAENAGSGDGSKALKKRVAIGCRQWKEIVDSYGIMEEDAKETRKRLLALQDLVSDKSKKHAF